jgi:Tol biopolymer transport system component
MGVVYRARDPRLRRDIAIKVLSSDLSTDSDRLARFEQEAQAAAALNHPNIVVIHSVEQAGDMRFLTMELVEGKTLAEVIPKDGLPLDRILRLGIQIADAVSTAHQLAIVHRDLKPTNVMVTSDGRVKVLDFGLAKLKEDPPVPTALTALPMQPQTAHGVIVGTVAYMSPEQAEGKVLDCRSDLFSMGIILHEMSTGERPFKGETSLSTLTSILRDSPHPVTELNANLPRELARIVRHALVKDPDQRYQTAKDLRNDLQELKQDIDSGAVVANLGSPVEAPFGSRTTRLRNRRRAYLALTVALGLALGLVALVVASRGWRAQSAQRASLDRLQIRQLTSSGNALWPAVSPDGKYVAYIQRDGNDYSLWIRQTTTASNIQILPPQPGVVLLGATVTFDAAFVDFVRAQTAGGSSELWRVPFLGGTPKRLIDNVDSLVEWSPDGQRITFLRSNPSDHTSHLVVADADGSDERVLARREGTAGFFGLSIMGRPSARPAWAPGGRTIAISAYDLKPGAVVDRIVFVDEATRSETALPGRAWGGLAWLDGASLVLSRSVIGPGPGQLSLLSYPDGKPSRLTNDLNSYDGISLTSDRSALVTTRTERRVGVWVGDAAANSGTDMIPPAAVEASGFGQGIAWAGDRLLYTGSGGAIMSVIPGRGSAEEIVSSGLSPAATSDGRTIVYGGFGPVGLWRADADGRHARQLLGELAVSPVVTRDDRQLIFVSLRSGVQSPWMMSIEGGTPTQVANVFAGPLDLSPDGRSMAFESPDDQNRTTIVVCELPACTSRRSLMPPAADAVVRWTPDGRGVAYIDAATQSNLWVQPLDGTSPRQFTHFADRRTIADFAWSRDGKRLAISRSMVTNDIVLFKGLR